MNFLHNSALSVTKPLITDQQHHDNRHDSGMVTNIAHKVSFILLLCACRKDTAIIPTLSVEIWSIALMLECTRCMCTLCIFKMLGDYIAVCIVSSRRSETNQPYHLLGELDFFCICMINICTIAVLLLKCVQVLYMYVTYQYIHWCINCFGQHGWCPGAVAMLNGFKVLVHSYVANEFYK